MKKVCATGAGSASPVVSMRMASKRVLRLSSLFSTRIRSPRTAATRGLGLGDHDGC